MYILVKYANCSSPGPSATIATQEAKNNQPTRTCTTSQVAAVSIALPDANSRWYDSSFANEPDNPVIDNKENENAGVLIDDAEFKLLLA